MRALTDKPHIHIQLIDLRGLLLEDQTERSSKHTSLLATLHDCLPPSGQQRLSRLRRSDDQLRHLVAHAALRLQLGQVLSIPAQDVPIRVLPSGKPVLDEAAAPSHTPSRTLAPLHFNISHAGDWVALAWCHRPVGIDVESLGSARNAMPDVQALCATPDEQTALAHSASPYWAFLHLWTGKEAVLKAHGAGLHQPMDAFALGEPDQDEWRGILVAAPRFEPPDLATYRVRRIPVDDSHAAAVAIAATATVNTNTADPHSEVTVQYIDAEDLIHTFGAKQQPSIWSLQA